MRKTVEFSWQFRARTCYKATCQLPPATPPPSPPPNCCQQSVAAWLFAETLFLLFCFLFCSRLFYGCDGNVSLTAAPNSEREPVPIDMLLLQLTNPGGHEFMFVWAYFTVSHSSHTKTAATTKIYKGAVQCEWPKWYKQINCPRNRATKRIGWLSLLGQRIQLSLINVGRVNLLMYAPWFPTIINDVK